MRLFLLPLFIVACILVAAGHPAAGAVGQPVALQEDADSFRLSNGILAARIDKKTGNLVSLRYRDLDLLGKGGGYWSNVGGRLGPVNGRRETSVRQDPKNNDGAIAEVSVRFVREEKSGGFPADVDYRYALSRGEYGLYVYSVWEHKAGYPSFSLAEARYAMKLNPEVFDFLTVDEKRRRVMPSGADWDRGQPLELKEVRKIVTGPLAGTVEHKYDYSAILPETPAYGWSSSRHRVGLWMVNPSFEYLSGGPTKVELTGHLDVNPGGAPTLLNMWVGSHYGGSAFAVAADEAWSKVVGPFVIYCNAGENHEGLWKDARAKAQKESEAWPYSWLKDPLYPPSSERAEVRGQLVLDPSSQASWSNLRIGVTPADYQARDRSGSRTVDWQREAKFYQFWSKANELGVFTIRNVRPGRYVLRAFGDGVPGEFVQANVLLAPGQKLDLGKLTWNPVSFGRTLWQIGKVDRTAAEFRNGDHYWQWGLFDKFPEQFPQGVNFVIGKSDPAKDWNYCQVPIRTGRRVESPSWAITFEAPESRTGTMTLRLGIAGSRAPSGVEVSVNDQVVGSTGPLPDTGTMHRDGIRGYWCERTVSFDAQLLRPGTNVIRLKVPAESWVNGVLYDYVRLEFQEAPPAVQSRKKDPANT
jgi:rhamnogalacturonan endolyase